MRPGKTTSPEHKITAAGTPSCQRTSHTHRTPRPANTLSTFPPAPGHNDASIRTRAAHPTKPLRPTAWSRAPVTQDRLPDADWCRRVDAALSDDEATRQALEKIGRPLFLKLKQDDEGPFVILRLAKEENTPRLTLHDEETVTEDGLIVSMTLDTWRRLLSGSLDLATGFMGRDVKAKGSMFELMRIADPAETVIKRFAEAVNNGGA